MLRQRSGAIKLKFVLLKLFFVLVTIGTFLIGPVLPISAATTAEQFAGKILIDAPRVEDIWYIHPKTHLRYYLGANVDAGTTVRNLATRINAKNLAKIPIVGEPGRGDGKMMKKFAGYFLMDMDAGGKLWYVSTFMRKRKPMSDTVDLQTALLRSAIQGSNAVLRRIPLAADSFPGPDIPPQITTIKKTSVATPQGVFRTTQLIVDRRNQHWRLMTDTADPADCVDTCTALSVRDFVRRHNGVAGIQGTYFCSSGGCDGGLYSVLWPVFQTSTRTMLNQARMKYITDPLVVIDTKNTPHYLPIGSEFGNVESYELANGITVQAAISNSPAMVEAGADILDTSVLNRSLRSTRATRTFFGWHGTYIYFVSVRSATLPEAAAVAVAMGLDYALNLDGGSSTGLYDDGAHVLGPGRNVPNAIVIVPH